MKKKYIIFIGGGTQQYDLVKFLGLNFKIILVDRNNNSPCKAISDVFINIDCNNKIKIFNNIKKLVDIKKILCSITFSELEETTNYINNKLGFPEVLTRNIKNFKDKLKFREICKNNNISAPEFIYNLHIKKLKNFLKIHKKIYLKKIISFGGKDSFPITSKRGLVRKLKNINLNEFYAEKLIKGSMIDVNGFMRDRIEIYGYFQRFFYKSLPIEIGSHYPAEINKNIERQCKNITEQAALCCGINFGPVKSDLILKNNKVYILEISSRLHGPKAFYLSSLVDKYNHLDRLIKSYIGKSIFIGKKRVHSSRFYSLLPRKLEPLVEISTKDIFTKYFGKMTKFNQIKDNTGLFGCIYIRFKNYTDLNYKIKKLSISIRNSIKSF